MGECVNNTSVSRCVTECDGIIDPTALSKLSTSKYPRREFAVHEDCYEVAVEKKDPICANINKLTLIARLLRDTAYSKGSTDNISVMVIKVIEDPAYSG